MDARTTVNLVREAQGGDAQALNQLLAQYQERVLRMVRLRMGPKLRARMDSMDVTQEVLQRAIMNLNRFDFGHEGAFLHWLRKLVQFEVLEWAEHYGAQKRDPEKELQKIAGDRSLSGEIPASSLWDPHRQLGLKEEFRGLESAMDSLDEEQREVILMRQYEDLSFPEIGKILGCSEDAARMKYARAMSKLSDLMHQNG